MVGITRQPRGVQALQEFALSQTLPGELGEEPQVLVTGEVGVERHSLRDVGNVFTSGDRIGADALPLDQRLAPRWLEEAQKEVDGGCLPSAVCAEETEDLALLDLDIQAVECDDAVERLRQFSCFEHGKSLQFLRGLARRPGHSRPPRASEEAQARSKALRTAGARQSCDESRERVVRLARWIERRPRRVPADRVAAQAGKADQRPDCRALRHRRMPRGRQGRASEHRVPESTPSAGGDRRRSRVH